MTRILAAEWFKFRSVAGPRWTVVSITLVLPVLSLLVAATGSLQPDDTILGASVSGGGVIALVLAGAGGAVAVAGETSTGVATTTFLAMPQRGRVLVAKAVVVAMATAAAAFVGSLAAWATGRLLLDSAVYAPGDPFPALLGVAASVALAGAIGVAIGAVVAHPAGAVGVAAGVVLLPGMFGPLLGGLEAAVVGVAPSGVLQKLAQSSDVPTDVTGSLSPTASLLVLAAYAGLGLLVSGWILERRDV